MAGMWSKLKKAFLLKYHPQPDPIVAPANPTASPPSAAVTPPSPSVVDSSPISSPASSFSRITRSFSVKSSSSKTCAICLGNVKTGKGQAIYTAECSHCFHFSCIASSVQHGFHNCPVCRSNWKDLPVQFPTGNARRPRYTSGVIYQNPAENNRNNLPPVTQLSGLDFGPVRFNDDEPLGVISSDATPSRTSDGSQSVNVKAFPEFPAIAASAPVSKFAVLVGVRAPPLRNDTLNNNRAPIDLVTVLDVSASMEGSKISLLKRAVQFVIQNLSPLDRLSIVVFSSTAQRIFPLRKMTDRGRDGARIAISSLSANGGTNIMAGLCQGAKILHERHERNPVASIILLSDGNDTYDLHYISQRVANPSQNSSSDVQEQLNIWLNPIRFGTREPGTEFRLSNVPVHTFGFGADHDSACMHAISDASGGTFSFIQSEDMVQDAFARCIGGLLSVVCQQLRLTVRSASSGVHIESIPSGRYLNSISEQGQEGGIDVGELYADEEKEFLVYLTIPVFSASEGDESTGKTSLLDVKCSYKEIMSMENVELEGKRVEIRRTDLLCPTDLIVSLEVDRQRNRIWVAEGITEAHKMAEQGNLAGAQALLTNRRAAVQRSPASQAGDNLCIWLEAELNEIKERMSSMELYQHTGRAYMRSGMSSHSWQRSTTRGSSTELTPNQSGGGGSSSNIGQCGYDTPSMVSMVTKSQTLTFKNDRVQIERPTKSCIGTFTP